MIITTSFEVDAPLEVVWTQMLDVPRIAHCVPGAQLTDVIDDRTYGGKIGIKLGPIDLAYRGRLHLEEINPEARTVKLRAQGNESRGRGGASAMVTATLRESGGRTSITMDSDINVTGLVAQFGRSAIMQDVSQRMAQRFATCLEQELKTKPTP